MKKKFLILILLTLFFTSCGYQPIYINQNLNKFVFKEILLSGDKNINRKIISAVGFKEDKTNYSFINLNLKTDKIITETSKNSKGQVESYKMLIVLNLEFKDKDNNLKTKSFSENFSYNKQANKFDLVEYERQIENNLTKKIIEDLIIFMNLK